MRLPRYQVATILQFGLRDFLYFLSQIRNSDKKLPKQLSRLIRSDVISTTGRNLRNIFLLTDKTDVDELKPSDANQIEYHQTDPEELWKADMIKKITR